jgi:hypothetical protein
MCMGCLDKDCSDPPCAGSENINLRKLKTAKNKDIVHMFSFIIRERKLVSVEPELLLCM